ncbi:hypothetical protein JYU34_019190 [Plutella xylostella]|uniref:Cytochrome P450 n=1 Tax=Plutella xylostella TaxID=51655 RepID=A0ABQ7PWG6_PLUXY|nr:hypothetical protein JYU34_019190 [Plutella xylostella]
MALTLSNACLAKNYMYKFASSWLGQGLITAEVPTWRQHRRLLCSAFNPSVLDGFVEVFNRQSERLTDALVREAGGAEFDHWPHFSENALQTICQTAFGIPPNEESVADKQYATAVGQMLGAVMTRASHVWMHFDRLYNLTRTKRVQDAAVKILKRTSLNVIEKRKATMKEKFTGDNNNSGTRRFKAFLDLLLELNNDGKITEQDVREEVDTMIVAGHDTTSHTLLMMFILLGAYPEVQERVYQELQEAFGDSQRYVTKEDLTKLVYTEAVVKETCRLYPVIPMLAREADTDIHFENFTIPAGTGILLCLYGIGRNPCWGPDADAFRPERWLDPASLPASPAAFAAFSLGRRGCMGKAQALMQMKTTVAHVIRKFKVTASDKNLNLKFDFMIKPTSGGQIKLELR